MVGDGGNATDIQAYDNEWLIVNLSVWESIAALREFTYKTAHVAFVRQRKSWFEKLETPFLALWWIPVSHIPTSNEAKQRLTHLEKHGDTPLAFTFRQPFESDTKMQAKVISPHSSNYPNPISFTPQERVQVGKRDDQFPGWIWTTIQDGNSGWSPEQFLDVSGDTAVAHTPYNATELNTKSGEILLVDDIVNAWYLVQNETGQEDGCQ